MKSLLFSLVLGVSLAYGAAYVFGWYIVPAILNAQPGLSVQAK